MIKITNGSLGCRFQFCLYRHKLMKFMVSDYRAAIASQTQK
ncbi:hypothetical protein yfred0001_15810 [Yersinia frederiksenii ATCC 33641]|nr:hypothetical protein yfred0001_15810 [Yersinia frederiksenii ATCC 33641]